MSLDSKLYDAEKY